MNHILSIDASGKTGGVCILSGGEVRFSHTINQGRTHSETLLPLVETAFSQTGLTPKDISLYAVTVGPGSFTGLRIALGLIKGLALPYNTPVAPVSTLLALAAGAENPGGIVIPALDARRGEVYWAGFSCSTKPFTAPQRLVEDQATPAETIGKNPLFKNSSVFFVGDGAEICYTMNSNVLNAQIYCDDKLPSLALGAALSAVIMQTKGDVYPAGDVFPAYLRLSQAERERAAKGRLETNTP